MKSYENKKNKIRFFVYVSIYFFFFGCVQKKPQQTAFWKEYLSHQKNIFREYPNGGIRNALFGNLTSEDVHLLQKKDDTLSIDFYLQKKDQGFRNVFTTEKIPKNVPYQIHVEYLPTFFKDQKTFQIKRKTISILPAYSYFDFFHHLDRLQNFLRSESNHSSGLASVSNTHRYLCYVCRCDSGRKENSSWLLYELNESTKTTYPRFYKRFDKLLNQISYRITIFKPGEFLDGIELYNEGTKTFLKIPDTPEGYWNKPETLHVRVSLLIRVYGLEIDIKDLGYKFRFYSSKNYEKITGEFSKFPEKKIGGRFLKIFPSGMANWFIPGNMDEYFDRYFFLLVYGSEGNGGNRFESEFFQNGDKMKVIFKSQAEIFQDRFTPFYSSNETDDEPSFWDILQKNLIEDLS
ncbi:hypothetical protein M5D10_00110 [Leptospira santarosai]|uniref:LIC10025 family lipoprotein n=1 Tax=Leptospira santarosai TaxID=28183 RepID=UPI0022A9EAFD|nr:hypothetical protein [Leptospira santarosai]UZN07433.1 hypothetical protein M5D10_00110 [Leptospira santarosai]